MIQELITNLLGGSVDNIGEFIAFFVILGILISFLLLALVLFGLFSSSAGLILMFKKNKKLGLGFLGLFILSIILALNGWIWLLVTLGVIAIIYSIYSGIKAIIKRIKKK